MAGGIAAAAGISYSRSRGHEPGDAHAESGGFDDLFSELSGEDRPSSFVYQPPDGPVPVHPPRRIFYLDAAEGAGQTFGDLYLPDSANPKMPVVVLIHGGGWSAGLGLGYMGKLAEDLASFDVAVWNIEYRRVRSGGGYPITLQDTCAAVDYLRRVNRQINGRLDLDRVAVCGHSAGGHLALWIAGRSRLPPELPGAQVRQPVHACVSLAGVADLVLAEQSGDLYLKSLLGTTLEQNRQLYVDASPITHLPTHIPVVAVHGDKDSVVAPVQSRNYVDAARKAGDNARLEIVPGANHDPWTDIHREPWQRVRALLLAMLAVPGHEMQPQAITTTAPTPPPR